MQDQLLVSSSPHIRDAESVPRIMWTVAAALGLPAVAGVVLFGLNALVVILVSVATAVATEALIQKLSGQKVTVSDGSAFVTGLLLAMVLPSSVPALDADGEATTRLLPLYVPIVGSFVAIAIAKHCFGGLGHNIWNPALVGRAFVQVAWASEVSLSAWPAPRWIDPPDAITQASPLFKGRDFVEYLHLELLCGNVPGCIGETCAIALILGGVFLIIRSYVNWRVPVCYVVTAALMVALLPPPGWWESADVMYLVGNPFYRDLGYSLPDALRGCEDIDVGRWQAIGEAVAVMGGAVLYHLLAGGLMLGAFFMATDMVTTPLTNKGLCIFGIGCGVLTVLIRFYGGYPEGVCYSILIMNTATPLIDRWCRPKVVGV